MGSIDDSVDTVDKRSKIIFDRPLALEEAVSLIKIVANELPADVVYSSTKHAGVYCGSNPSSETVNELRSVELGGSIRKIGDGYPHDTFQSLPVEDDPVLIKGIRFFIIPGYRLKEYNPHIVKLWDEVRDSVQRYFQKSDPRQATVSEEVARS
jgi:hypothetical protein